MWKEKEDRLGFTDGARRLADGSMAPPLGVVHLYQTLLQVKDRLLILVRAQKAAGILSKPSPRTLTDEVLGRQHQHFQQIQI